jgi:uncharacterized protein (TIGR03437 family)
MRSPLPFPVLFLILWLVPVHAQPQVFPGGVVNAAGFAPAPAPVAPGSIAALFGNNLAAATSAAGALPLPTKLGEVQVFLNDTAAPLLFVSPGQINLQIPWQLSGSSQVSARVVVNDVPSNTITVNVAAAAPGCFTLNQSGQGAIVHALSGVVVAPEGSVPGRQTAPANPGDYLSLYCTGVGEVTNAPASGAAALVSPLSWTTVRPAVEIGGVAASDVSFYGLAPGFVGLYQINAQVPPSAPGGDAIPVLVTAGGMASNWTTISVRNPATPLVRYRLTMTASGAGSGTLTANPTGPDYPAGTSVAVTATPNAGSVFVAWSGACSGSSACRVTMNSDKQVGATFSPSSVAVSVSPPAATVRAATTQQFTATVAGTANPAVTWTVNQITGGNAEVGTISPAGVYTAPTTVPTESAVAVRAVSAADPSKSAAASVLISINPFLGILEGAANFPGPYPAPAAVSYRNASGQTEEAWAYPGQVQVFFRTGTTEGAATAAIQAAGGQIIAKVPRTAYYLVRVAVGGEAALIALLLPNTRVSLAVPNIANVLSGDPKVHTDPAVGLIPTPIATRGMVAIDVDGAADSHGQKVVEAACRAGACITDVIDIRGLTTPGDVYLPESTLNMILYEIIQGAKSGGSNAPVYVNISSNGVAVNRADKAAGLAAWKLDMVTKLQAVAALSDADRDQLVLTISAGNDGLDIGPALAEIRSENPLLGAILSQNCVIAATDLLLSSNHASNDMDVVTINNIDAADGTSFGSPGILAVIKQVIEQTGVTRAQAVLAVKGAALANAKHELVLSEAIAMAQLLRGSVITYQGTFDLTKVVYNPEPGCSPNPDPMTFAVKGAEIRLLANTAIESVGTFSGHLLTFPATHTISTPARTCGSFSYPPYISEGTEPGFIVASPSAAPGWTSSGTSDGRVFSIPMLFDFFGAPNPPPMTGTVAVSGSSVTLTLAFSNSSALIDGTPTTTTFSATLTKR